MTSFTIKCGIVFVVVIGGTFLSCKSQPNKNTMQAQSPRKDIGGMAAAANAFLQTLSEKQKGQMWFEFEDKERYNWHYIPKSRNGIPLKDLSAPQKESAMKLLHTALSDTGFEKTTAIFQLEGILRETEGRPPGDTYRDPGKYYFSIFGNPASDSAWGWRLEGHHVSFNFSAKNNELVSGTPGFLGTNPAIVLSGPEKGKQILKDETELGFALLHALDQDQSKQAIISDNAPAEIITGADRKALIEHPEGIAYGKLNASQQKMFIELLSIYIHRYTRMFALTMMKEIETAGLDKLRFAWAGAKQPGIGHPHYYRIQGPTIIIEYDNTQNDANHVHTVIRDLKNDFGDELLEHYKKNSH